MKYTDSNYFNITLHLLSQRFYANRLHNSQSALKRQDTTPEVARKLHKKRLLR